MERPGPGRWLWYAMGGALPAQYRWWVLHDVTDRHWRWRALFRALVQILPAALLLYLLLPTEPWVRLMAIGGGMLVGMIYAVAYLEESTEQRATKAGFPHGTARAMRGDEEWDFEGWDIDGRDPPDGGPDNGGPTPGKSG